MVKLKPSGISTNPESTPSFSSIRRVVSLLKPKHFSPFSLVSAATAKLNVSLDVVACMAVGAAVGAIVATRVGDGVGATDGKLEFIAVGIIVGAAVSGPVYHVEFVTCHIKITSNI